MGEQMVFETMLDQMAAAQMMRDEARAAAQAEASKPVDPAALSEKDRALLRTAYVNVMNGHQRKVGELRAKIEQIDALARKKV
jgi:hypothetical protein